MTHFSLPSLQKYCEQTVPEQLIHKELEEQQMQPGPSEPAAQDAAGATTGTEGQDAVARGLGKRRVRPNPRYASDGEAADGGANAAAPGKTKKKRKVVRAPPLPLGEYLKRMGLDDIQDMAEEIKAKMAVEKEGPPATTAGIFTSEETAQSGDKPAALFSD